MELFMNFYESLPVLDRFDQVADPRVYRELPDDWCVMVSDIRGSTLAVEAGRYREVNMAGASSISCLLNMVKPAEVPFVFGGDGATACIPGEMLGKVRPGLAGLRRSVKAGLGFDMRVGIVPVADIRRAGQTVRLARFRVSPMYVQAVFAGGGLQMAETLIKDPTAKGAGYLVDDSVAHIEPDLSGLQCRWHTIPSKHGETIALLVKTLAKPGVSEESVYREVLEKVMAIFGSEAEWHPVHEEKMQLSLDKTKLGAEIAIQNPRAGWLGKALNMLLVRGVVVLGRVLMNRGWYFNKTDWSKYKSSTIANTDHRKFDEMVRCILAGTRAQREELTAFLQGLRDRGLVAYGIHASDSATMTCFIREYGGQHFHFVDATGGGYTMAAKQLKGQLKEK
jgi:hypothetical protein